MRRGRARKAAVLALMVALALACAGSALGAFPGSPPPDSPYPSGQENPRFNAPNDEEFDRCEPATPENPDGGQCDSYFSEQFKVFGFRPESARNPLLQPLQYDNCAQLDAQGRDANVKNGDPECAVIGGIRADSAWKFSTGDPKVVVAIFDNGIEWDAPDLIDKVHLNAAELPAPQTDGAPLRTGLDCATYTGTGDDVNDDGAFNVADFACDPRVARKGGDEESDTVLEASDLIAAFSDGSDADGNRYTDDIAGWDFFDDDNDPLDSAACCQGGHGTDRAADAAAETNNGLDEAGVCPDCQVMVMRTSDDIVHDTNLIAMATVYAADNGAGVTECACGALVNPAFGRRAFAYADQKGLAQMMVSSDINSANHNYPTNYNEAIYVSGSLPDTAPTESCDIPSFPGFGGGGTVPGCANFAKLLRDAGVPLGLPGQIPTTSFFRNPNLTQYGGKNDIVLVGNTGSENTGQSAGAAGLLRSYGLEVLGAGRPLSGNEIRQLLTMTAEDVLPENTGRIGQPDRADPGWDSHFGYGRVNLAAAMRRIQQEEIPPEVQIDAPDWFAPINLDRVGASGVPVHGRVSTPRFDGVSWTLEYACGQEVAESAFKPLGSGSGDASGELARIPRSVLQDLADNCDGSVTNDAGRPAGRVNQPNGTWPANPYPEPDPERHAFQIRLTARQQGNEDNLGQYRKTLFAYNDDGNLDGWPRPLGPNANPELLRSGSGGEASPRLADLDADDRLDVILPASAGEVHVLDAQGDPLPSWNDGQPVRTLPYPQSQAHGVGGIGGDPPREPPRVPAVGDITGDGEPEVVVTALEHVYAWERDGTLVQGFPRRVDPALSAPCKPGRPSPCFDEADRLRTPDHHVKRGYVGSPALADLDEDGRLDVVAGALDQHLYAYDGEGKDLPGFPVRLDSEAEEDGAEIVVSPAIADLDGDDDPEVVIATNEIVGADNDNDFDPDDLLSLFVGNATGANPTYAVHGDGKRVDGWPVRNGVLVGNLLPLVLPSHPAAVADFDPGRKGDEVSISSASGSAKLVASDGDTLRTYSNQPLPPPASNITDLSLQLNLADYPSVGRLSDADGLSVIKGGLSLLGAANLVATNQNLPFNHTVQAWEPRSGAYRRGWPVATDDFQLLTEPAIARVGGDGAGRQALVGTGLYQLHAYGADGTEPAGWPKFTGGWQVATPSVGDVDGDGKLEVAQYTREGFAFTWRTGVPACNADGTTTNAEWHTFSHDEHGTNNYGHDARPPSIPGSPQAQRLANGDVRLTFTGSGDDGRCGQATRYEVAGSTSAIGSGAQFVAAQGLQPRGAATSAQAISPPRGRAASAARNRARSARAAGIRPRAAGDTMEVVVPAAAALDFFAVRAVDDAANRSYVASTGQARAAATTTVPGSRPAVVRPVTTPVETDDGDGRDLPFTGLALGLLALAGLILLGGGLALRRRRPDAAE